MKIVKILAGAPDVFVALEGGPGQVEIYQLVSSAKKGTAQLGKPPSASREQVLKQLNQR